ncbi:MAG: zinc-dependent metalloprotease [Acidobacteria bacterium]|nr:zinc-dependent metalloprotease [Acidobacteriota bacterium]
MDDQPFDLPPEVFRRVPLFAEIARALSWQGGPVNWDIARQVAGAVASDDAEIDSRDAEEARADVRLAEMWLIQATGLPEPAALVHPEALTPSGWADRAADRYRELIDPLAQRISTAVGGHAPEDPEQQMVGQALRHMAPLFLGIQTGAMLGALSRDMLSQYDVPLPLGTEGSAVLLLPSIDAFAGAYGLDRREARIWAALHESAHRIQFEALPWIRAHFFALYHNYVAQLEFDLRGAMERLQSLDLSNPEQLRDALGESGLIGLVDSPAIRSALDRVQDLVATIDSYADRAVEAAATGRLAAAAPLAEASARRRADQTRGERLFQQFIGLDLGPARRRSAEVFTRAVLASGGWRALNRLWDEPENLPVAAETGDPEAWIRRVERT